MAARRDRLYAFGVVRVTALLLATLLVVAACGPEEPPGSTDKVPLGALYTIGYGFEIEEDTGQSIGGIGSSLWNDAPGRSGVVYEPPYGFYVSSDPQVIAQHVADMRAAGISWLLVSWHGWGDRDLDGRAESGHFEAEDDALKAVFRYVDRHAPDMKVAVLVEPFMHPIIHPEDLTDAQKQRVLDYIWDNYYSVYPDSVFNWQGKPLLVTWGPEAFRLRLDDVGDDRFTHRLWGDSRDAVSDWNFFPQDGLQGIEEQIADDGQVWITPRYDQFYFWLASGGTIGSGDLSADIVARRRIDPTLKGGFYDRAWEVLFRNRSKVKLPIIYAWNNYGEQSFLEPATSGPYPPGRMLIEKTRHYYELFNNGQAFRRYEDSFTPTSASGSPPQPGSRG